MPKRDVKGKEGNCPMHAGSSCHAGSLAIVDYPQVARTCILRVLHADDAILSVFIFLVSASLRSIVQSFFRCACAPRQPHAGSYYINNNCLCPPMLLSLYLFFGHVASSEYFCTVAISFSYGVYVVRFRHVRLVFFYRVTTGWILTSAYYV